MMTIGFIFFFVAIVMMITGEIRLLSGPKSYRELVLMAILGFGGLALAVFSTIHFNLR